MHYQWLLNQVVSQEISCFIQLKDVIIQAANIANYYGVIR
ncbi:hypothetical protein HMPREF1562_1828 [Providencia alcalifaciens F90-2004]|nr:hypothetical protein HMPREF1562_1828 [Providencia alcalifaciens F90-2004]